MEGGRGAEPTHGERQRATVPDMRLHWSPRSPFVRKVMVVAHEHGLVERIDRVRSVAATTTPNLAIMADNPLSKIPAMVLGDGSVLHDSRVICEYLDTIGGAPALFPPEPARWSALRRQALGDGMLDLAVAWRGERNRDAALQSRPHLDAYRVKARATLDRLEREAPPVDTPIDIGWITIGCALGYLDFRFADLDWRARCPALAAWFARFAQRPSMMATRIADDSGESA